MKLGFIGKSVTLVAVLVLWSLCCVEAATLPSDTAALRAFRSQIVDNNNRLRNWFGNDPCGNGTNWEGVFCTPDSNGIFHVTELRLLNHQLSGTLAPEIGNLESLRILDVMWNTITGSIPSTFGMLGSLELLLLNGNRLTGVLPWELGNLTNMNRIQIDENTISGPVPPTFGNLTNVMHFHMNNNSLNGSIPPDLGRLPKIVHILFDNNHLSGTLPVELSNLKTLLILQLDNNRFDDNAVIPGEYGAITTLFKLSMRNCSLRGPVPDLSNISQLGYLDLSNNRLSGTIPGTGISRNMTSIDLSTNNLTGDIPQSFHNLPMLQALILSNNNMQGFVSGALIDGTNSSQRLLLDLQNNNFSSVDQLLINNVTSSTGQIRTWLAGNPVCADSEGTRLAPVCQNGTLTSQTSADQGHGNNQTSCPSGICLPGQNELIPALSAVGQCLCASPAVVGYRLKSPGFTFFDRYVSRFESYISGGLNLTLPQIYLKDFTWESGPRLKMDIAIFPNTGGNRTLNISELRRLYRAFGGWLIPDDDVFGPYEFISFTPPFGVSLYDIIGPPPSKKLGAGGIVGIVLGVGAATGVIVGLVVFYLARRKTKRTSASRKKMLVEMRELNEMLKVTGVKSFTYQEMSDATDSFRESRVVGQGGYGIVYRGVLSDGLVVAVKRAEEGSLQGFREFYTEIELLSRVHHRNLLSLVGYCDDENEQMLVYEFMEGGTLRERLSPSIKLPLDFPSRLRIALGAARGILYLHTEANPPIFHRDIKASNILLDAKNTPKVADFGLSKLAPAPDIDGSAPGHVSTVVKGTPGYLDPEYFLTRKLTDKSDVYSFGVVLMELVTGMHPISQGKNLVREVISKYQAGMVLSIVDQNMGSYPSEGLEPMIRLALNCVKEDPNERPSMAEVVRDLEDTWRSMPWSDALSTAEHSVREKEKDASPLRLDVYNEMYPSSNILEETGLFSGTVQAVAPR